MWASCRQMPLVFFAASAAWSGALAGNVTGSSGLRGAAGEAGRNQSAESLVWSQEAYNFSEVPDLSLPPASPGPYEEEPDEAEAENPRPAMANWTGLVPNASLGLSSHGAVGTGSGWPHTHFCDVHHTGYFCSGSSRVRCCRNHGWYVQCGTQVHSRRCGWGGGRGGGWQIHRGWHQSSFCVSHHTGSFCSSHKRIHCCNDHGHFVE